MSRGGQRAEKSRYLSQIDTLLLDKMPKNMKLGLVIATGRAHFIVSGACDRPDWWQATCDFASVAWREVVLKAIVGAINPPTGAVVDEGGG